MSLTPEGELYLEHARRILGDIADMGELLGLSKATPKGLLRLKQASSTLADLTEDDPQAIVQRADLERCGCRHGHCHADNRTALPRAERRVMVAVGRTC